MIYKFKSKAAGDVIMLEPSGDQVLKAIGRDPAAKGIFEAADLPAAIVAIERAIADEEARRAEAEAEAKANGQALPPPGLGLRQRAWPLIEMMRRSHAAGQPIVWGV